MNQPKNNRYSTLPYYRNRLIGLLLVFAITGFLAVRMTLTNSQPVSFNAGEKNISIIDTALVSRVIIEKIGGEKLELEKNEPGVWVVNKNYKARKQLSQFLLFGLHELVVKRPVPQNSKSQATRILKEEGVKVTVIVGDDMRMFKIAANPGDVNSSYFQENGAHPLIVYVPGVKGNIYSLLNLKIGDWRAREIFTSQAVSIRMIKITYKDKNREGFEIFSNNNTFQVRDIENTDQQKLKKYISLFGFLGAESYLPNDSINNSLLRQEPDATIELTDRNERKNRVLNIYYDFNNKGMMGVVQPGGERVRLNPQIYKFVLTDKKFFKSKDPSI